MKALCTKFEILVQALELVAVSRTCRLAESTCDVVAARGVEGGGASKFPD